MWICSNCGARVEPSFDVCWKCGTSYQGEADADFVTADEAPPIRDPTDYLRLEPGKRADDELPEPPLELASCFESNDLIEVKFVADQLVAAGIPATIQNTHNRGTMPVTSYSLYPPRVVVRAEDLPQARGWVDGYLLRRKARESRAD